MPTLYLRPTGDVYSTHGRYPTNSPSVYTLINEETYKRLKPVQRVFEIDNKI